MDDLGSGQSMWPKLSGAGRPSAARTACAHSLRRAPSLEEKMIAWEYQTIQIVYDKKGHKDWVLNQEGGRPQLVGLQAILGAFGAQGWELVSVGPEHFEIFPGLGKYYAEPAVYRATFKRPVGQG